MCFVFVVFFGFLHHATIANNEVESRKKTMFENRLQQSMNWWRLQQSFGSVSRCWRRCRRFLPWYACRPPPSRTGSDLAIVDRLPFPFRILVGILHFAKTLLFLSRRLRRHYHQPRHHRRRQAEEDV